MLAGLATWTVHGENLTTVPELYTGTHEFAASLNPESPLRAHGRGVPPWLFGGWGGMRWAAGLDAFLAPLRLAADCPGAGKRIVLCAEVCFHARGTRTSLQRQPGHSRIGHVRIIAGVESHSGAVPEVCGEAFSRRPRRLRDLHGPRGSPAASAHGGGRRR